MKISKSHLYIFSGGFAGGLLTGIFFTKSVDQKQLKQLLGKIKEAGILLEKSTHAVRNNTIKRFYDVSERWKKGLSDPIPDLYRATETFTLDEDDLKNAW